MSKTPFMPLWVSDFLGDTLDLDASEIGAYMLLLMAQWNRDGGSLPDDGKKLQRVARCGRNWPKVWGNIQRYFQTDENGIYSVRLRKEAQNVASKREVNAHNGALGGSAKALKTKEPDIANATISLQRNSSIPEPEPERDTKVSLKGFDAFWEIAPRKVGKGGARKAYAKALKIATPDELLDGMKRHVVAMRGKEQNFIPHPARWLNEERWLDRATTDTRKWFEKPESEWTKADRDAERMRHL
jgi:uncharacterized protein YdaU (DUF1376 family)